MGFSPIEKVYKFLSHTVLVRKVRNNKLVVDSYEIEYSEFNARISNGESSRMAEVWMFDFTPGVVFKIVEIREGYFDIYRNELNAMINSIKFYPDLKKD